MTSLENNDNKSDGKFWKVIGGVALALVTAGLIANMHDIKRLVRIHTM